MFFTDEELAHDVELTATELLEKRGGNWLGYVREWIKCNARNGEHVTWGSHDLLHLRSLSTYDIEHLAAGIAAAAGNQVLREIKSLIRRLRPSGLGVKSLTGDVTVTTPIVTHKDGGLNHTYCCSAYSWLHGRMIFGQGTFTAVGQWSNPCTCCTDATKNNTREASEEQDE